MIFFVIFGVSLALVIFGIAIFIKARGDIQSGNATSVGRIFGLVLITIGVVGVVLLAMLFYAISGTSW